jgi:D-alanyl-D-alanine carboxypeptidase/D-alanyl-D-alanine-endopeptidase (penicillin-binding protein 4)
MWSASLGGTHATAIEPVVSPTLARSSSAASAAQSPPASASQSSDLPPSPDEIPINPLTAAYAESLEARGYTAENQGLIVETAAGEVLVEHNADRLFNPASVVKMATSLVAIARLGPDFRFRTFIYTDGTHDPATQTLNGSLHIVGSGDPAFFTENVLLIVDQLNRSGIRHVNGNLVVQGQFHFNFSGSSEVSAKLFRKALTPATHGAEINGAFARFLAMRAAAPVEGGNGNRPRTVTSQIESGQPDYPSLTVSGETQVDATVNTSGLHLLAVHTSLPLVRVLKVLNDFSNNWMASVIGRLVGGPDAVEQFLQNAVGLRGEEIRIVTASGLGTNLISPRGTTQILRKLIAYLEKNGLTIADLLPVAGVDAGTLERRFTDQFRAAVVAKTGTLSGVSALAGVAYTKGTGPLLFVIYNRGGSAASFRGVQDEMVKKLITLHGGPAPVRYSFTGMPGLQQTAGQSPGLASPR